MVISPGKLQGSWFLEVAQHQLFAIKLVAFAVDFVLSAPEFGTFAVVFFLNFIWYLCSRIRRK